MFTFHHCLHIFPVVTFGERLEKSASNETVSCFYFWHETTSLKIPVEGMQADTHTHARCAVDTHTFQVSTWNLSLLRFSQIFSLSEIRKLSVRSSPLPPGPFSLLHLFFSVLFILLFFLFLFWTDSQNFTGVHLSKITKLQFASVWYRNIE